MKADSALPRRPDHWGALAGCLLDFEAYPGRFPLALREPRLLFDHGTEVLSLASGRAVEGLPQDAALEARLRHAARYFVRTALLRPGVDHYALLGLTPGFDPAVLREHYRMLMRLTHPDFAGGGGEWPASAATRINQANDVLSSPQRRHDYDLAQPRGRQWAPSVVAPAVPRPGLGPKPPLRRGVPAFLRHRGVLAGVAVAGALGLGAWLWSGMVEGDHGVSLELGARMVVPVPEPTTAPTSTVADLSPVPAAPVQIETAPALTSVVTAESAAVAELPAPARIEPEPARPAPAVVPVPVRLAAAAPAVALPGMPPVPVRGPEKLVPIPSVAALAPAPAPATVGKTSEQPMAAAPVVPVAEVPLATAAVLPPPFPPPAPVTVPQAAQLAQAVPAARPPAARDAGTPGGRVSMADVQPLLGQLLGVLQSGRVEQVLRWVEPPSRPGDGADGFVQTYNRLVAHTRNVRLGPARFSGRPMGENLQVEGVVLLYLQDEDQQPATRELVLRAQFASRGGQPVLTQLNASEALR